MTPAEDVGEVSPGSPRGAGSATDTAALLSLARPGSDLRSVLPPAVRRNMQKVSTSIDLRGVSSLQLLLRS